MSVGACVLVAAVVVVAGTQLLLFGPSPDVAHATLACGSEVHLAGGRSYPFNCDSNRFLGLAHHPDRLLRKNELRQSRPGYVALAAVSTDLGGSVAKYLGLDRQFGQSDSAYFPEILINAALLIAAACLLAFLLRRLGAPPRIAIPALLCVLVMNDVTKAFFWTPHQQMFIMLVPLASIMIGAWAMRVRPGWRTLTVLGFVIGLVSLCYAGVLITVAVLAVILLLRGRDGWRLTAVLGGAFLLPQLIWIAVCEVLTGTYFNDEIRNYHEFVWLPQAVLRGPRTAYRDVSAEVISTIRSFVSMGGLPLIFLLALVIAAIVAGLRLAPATDDERRILISTGLTIVVSTVFAFGVGVGVRRTVFNAFPAILLLIGWVTAKLIASPTIRGRLAVLAVPLATLAFVVHEIAKHGPYS